MSRYASGEEPMVGDYVRFDEGHSERSVRDVLCCGSVVVMRNGEHWATEKLRLIDRPRSPSGHTREPAKPEAASLNQVYYCEPPMQEELEKRWPNYVSFAGQVGEALDMVAVMPTRLNYECDWPGSGSVSVEALRAVQDFARWLAEPTMAERYAEFRATVAHVLETSCLGLDVEAVTDNTRDGVLLRFWCDDFRADNVFALSATERELRNWVEWIVEDVKLKLGDKAIRRRDREALKKR